MDFDHKVLFVDEEGKLLSEEKFQDAYCFCEGMAAVKENDQWGFINAQGELVIDYRYDDVSEGFREGVAAVEKDGAFYFIDQYGERAFEQEFEAASGFSEGLAAVQSDGKWGYIDHSGEFVIDCQYDGAGDFSEEKAAVMKETDGVCKWAYITPKNEIVIDYQLYATSEGRMQMVGEFHQGYALVTAELYCLINEQGETVLGNDTYFLTAGGIYDLDTGYLAAYEYTDEAMTEKKYGVINVNGEIIVPFVYENIAEIKGGLAVVTCREENELKTGVLRMDNLPAQSEGESDKNPERTKLQEIDALLEMLNEYEKESYLQVQRAKKLNDELMEAYPNDEDLMRLLIDKEKKLDDMEVSNPLLIKAMRKVLEEERKREVQRIMLEEGISKFRNWIFNMNFTLSPTVRLNAFKQLIFSFYFSRSAR